MEKVKEIINASWFRAAVLGFLGIMLLLEKKPLYAGISLGMGIREFILAFKKDDSQSDEPVKTKEDATKRKSTKK